MNVVVIETIDQKLALWIAQMLKDEYSDIDIFFTLLAGVEVMRKQVEGESRSLRRKRS